MGILSPDLVLTHGDPAALERALADDPALATRELGERNWLPLVYVTHSPELGGERTDALVRCAELLLDAGADPHSAYPDFRFGPQSALYGAAGVNHEPRMTALLLERGANPDPGIEAGEPYHGTALDWARRGSENADAPEGADYETVIELLEG